MLTAFEPSLKRLHADGTAKSKELWMAEVKTAHDQLIQSYQQLTAAGRLPIDYSTPAAQAAYIYAYAMPRAYFTNEMLRRHRAAVGRPLFNSGAIEIISFGGGPASELVGILQYLSDPQHNETVTAISYRVFDKFGTWKKVAKEVVNAVGTDIKVVMTYDQLDLADAHACAAVHLDGANLLVFSYIMSELCALNEGDVIAQNILNIVSGIDSSFSMLFIDSKHPNFIKYFTRCREFIGNQKNDDGQGINLPLPKMTPTFKLYQQSLDRDPRLDAMIVSKWLVKA